MWCMVAQTDKLGLKGEALRRDTAMPSNVCEVASTDRPFYAITI
jgi:hypothetical protein